MSEETLQIEVRVEGYVPNAMQEDYKDGFASFDATRVDILAPIEFRGRQLMIFHDTPPSPGTPWRRPGARLRARIERASLTGTDTLFAGALSAVQEVPPESR